MSTDFFLIDIRQELAMISQRLDALERMYGIYSNNVPIQPIYTPPDLPSELDTHLAMLDQLYEDDEPILPPVMSADTIMEMERHLAMLDQLSEGEVSRVNRIRPVSPS
jgi:hypothetical protein